jgi:hypothetical protein
MSYKGMGTTATDIAALTTAASTAAAQLIAAGRGGTTPYVTPGSIDPATGMPYATAPMINPATGLPYPAIDPATGLPYGTPASDYTIPLVIGGLLLVGVGGYFFMRKSKSTPNRRRRSRRNSRRRSSRMVRRNAAALSTWNKAWSAALKRANQTGTTTHFGMVNGVREMWAGSAPAGAEHITTVEPTKKFFAGSAFAGRAKGGSRRSRKRSRRNSRRRSSRRVSRRRSSRGSYKRRVTKRVQYATRHSGGRWGNPGRIAARIRREEFGRMMWGARRSSRRSSRRMSRNFFFFKRKHHKKHRRASKRRNRFHRGGTRRNSRRSSLRRNALYGLSASGRGLHAIATDPDLTRIYHHQRDAEAALARLMRKAGDEGQHIQWTIQYRGGHGIVKMPVTYFTRFPLPSLRSLGPLRPRS